MRESKRKGEMRLHSLWERRCVENGADNETDKKIQQIMKQVDSKTTAVKLADETVTLYSTMRAMTT